MRRWLAPAACLLAVGLTSALAQSPVAVPDNDGWVTDLDQLKGLEKFASDKDFLGRWQEIKRLNKQVLAEYLDKYQGLKIDTASMFDVQVKRIHEYKRQLLFTLYVIQQYLLIKNMPSEFIQPRTFMIGGKAAPGYQMAKLIIKFINNVAKVINHDKSVNDKIKLVFLENYRVSLAERVFPGSELSEQISMASTEASGTGNMKFTLNGALTIGTYDGANIEIAEQVGQDNIFIFGLRSDEVQELKSAGYRPQEYITKSPYLAEIIKLIRGNYFSLNEPDIFRPIVEMLCYNDPYLICADFEDYCRSQSQVSNLYKDTLRWNKKSVLNVANAGFFSSDRTIRSYAEEIWGLDNIKKNLVNREITR